MSDEQIMTDFQVELGGAVQAKGMTTKEVAEALGTSPNVISENAKKYLNKQFEKGKAARYTEEEVTVLLEKMREHPSNNSNEQLISSTYKLSTRLSADYKSAEFVNSQDYHSDEGRRVVTQAIFGLCEGLLRDLSKENAMLKHQAEYNATIGTMRWRDVKKALGLSVTKEQMLADTHLEEDVDYFFKCMGYDKYPTLLLTDNALSIIKKTYPNREEK